MPWRRPGSGALLSGVNLTPTFSGLNGGAGGPGNYKAGSRNSYRQCATTGGMLPIFEMRRHLLTFGEGHHGAALTIPSEKPSLKVPANREYDDQRRDVAQVRRTLRYAAYPAGPVGSFRRALCEFGERRPG